MLASTAPTYTPFTLRYVYISKNFGICLVMVFKEPRLLATIVATILMCRTPQKIPHIEQVAGHLEPSSAILTLELNPLAHLFIFTRSYFPSVHLLHSIVAKQAV